MAEERTPKRRSRGHSTRASVGEGLGVHIGLWERSLRAANRSAKTVQVYLESVRRQERFLQASSLPTAPGTLRREHIEVWIEDFPGRCKPATASVRFRSVQQFFKFLAQEGEIEVSPMRAMRPPIVWSSRWRSSRRTNLNVEYARSPAGRSPNGGTWPSGSSSTPACVSRSWPACGSRTPTSTRT